MNSSSEFSISCFCELLWKCSNCHYSMTYKNRSWLRNRQFVLLSFDGEIGELQGLLLEVFTWSFLLTTTLLRMVFTTHSGRLVTCFYQQCQNFGQSWSVSSQYHVSCHRDEVWHRCFDLWNSSETHCLYSSQYTRPCSWASPHCLAATICPKLTCA